MGQDAPRTIILGAGPVGLVAALFAARRGPVTVVLPRGNPAYSIPRIDSIPVALLALLVEAGLHPSSINAETVHDSRLVAWQNADPAVVRGAATVHVERPLLERSLLALTERQSRISFASGMRVCDLPSAVCVLDATGRRAVSAKMRFAPRNPAMCRGFIVRGVFSASQQSFRIAALPAGYAYRIGNQRIMMVGFVQGRKEWATSALSVDETLRRFRADWLLAGLPKNWQGEKSRGGVASLQWTSGDGPIRRVGDAALARDALASQGVANGISDGLAAIEEPHSSAPDENGASAECRLHARRLHNLIQDCCWRDSDYWNGYSNFLLNCVYA